MKRSEAAPTSIDLTSRPQWRALQSHVGDVGRRHLREMFASDPARGDHLQAEGAGLYFDYSKQRVTGETLRLLMELGNACGLTQRIAAMFRGDKINETENRAAFHVALRAPAAACIEVDGENVVHEAAPAASACFA